MIRYWRVSSRANDIERLEFLSIIDPTESISNLFTWCQEMNINLPDIIIESRLIYREERRDEMSRM